MTDTDHTSEVGLTLFLAILCVLLFVVYPFFQPDFFGQLVVSISMSLLLLSSALATAGRRTRLLVLGLAVLPIVARWLYHFWPSRLFLDAYLGLTLAYLGFTAFALLRQVLKGGRVSSHRVRGAVAAYLVLGLAWAFLYALVELHQPSSFDFGSSFADVSRWIGTLVYFSYVTLSTLGYGDVTPVGSLARHFAVLEALVGQLYLVVLLARLVSLQVAGRQDPPAPAAG